MYLNIFDLGEQSVQGCVIKFPREKLVEENNENNVELQRTNRNNSDLQLNLPSKDTLKRNEL